MYVDVDGSSEKLAAIGAFSNVLGFFITTTLVTISSLIILNFLFFNNVYFISYSLNLFTSFTKMYINNKFVS